MPEYKMLTEQEIEKLITENYNDLPGVTDTSMQKTLKTVINNTQRMMMNEDNTTTGDVAQFTPVIMSLIRRTMPTLVGPQMVGMQAMSQPTGSIFVERVYAGENEIWGNGTIGTATVAGKAPDPAFSGPYTTADGEKLGWKDYSAAPTGQIGTGTQWPEMSFGIERMDVSVKMRALKGRLTTEVIQDLRTVHGIDADQEIVNILQTELTAEIDREIVARIIKEAKVGAQNCAKPGTFDFAVDADGRWSMEKVMGLLIQIEREATWIAQETRRGRGNFILTSPEVAAYLSMANLISTQYQNTGFTPVVNPVGVSYYGMLANRFKVFVDPYMTSANTEGALAHTLVVGYKGANQYDSGLFYCPYIPIQMFRAVGEEDFGPRYGVKSRYGLVSNPYSIEAGQLLSKTEATESTNSFFRKISVVI